MDSGPGEGPHGEAVMMPPTSVNIDVERGILSALLQGVDPQLAFTQLVPRDFFDRLHGRFFAHFKSMVEAGERPSNVITAMDGMDLDETERARLVGLPDPLVLIRGTPEELAGYIAIVKRRSCDRDLRLACEAMVKNVNGDIGPTLDLQLRLNRYLEVIATKPSAEEFFDTWDEWETTPPLTFAIKGFLQNDGITGIAGLSGDGKTWTALAIARALLFGPGKLWDLFHVPERAEKVIYLIPECSRTPFKYRLERTHVYDELRTGRMLVRTLSRGKTQLNDPRLLRVVPGSYIILDTAIRFAGIVDDNQAAAVAFGLSMDMSELLRAGARAVIPLFASPKAFENATSMSLENMVRGSSEFGAVLSTCWGIKQLDKSQNIVHIENLKPRDFDPCGPFELVGRPHIDETGDFRVHKRPGDCGCLSDEQPELHRGVDNLSKQEARKANLALMATWLTIQPYSNTELKQKFAAEGITVHDSTIRGYRHSLRQR